MQRNWLELSDEEKTAIKIQSREWFEAYRTGFVEAGQIEKKRLEASLSAYQSCEDDEIKSLSNEQREQQISHIQNQLSKFSLNNSPFRILIILLADSAELLSNISVLHSIGFSESERSQFIADYLLEFCEKKELDLLNLTKLSSLDLLSSTQWQLLDEKGFFKNLSRVDLSHNKIATCSAEIIKAICFAFRSARYVNLSNNGFNACTQETWNVFCNALRSIIYNHSTSLIIEINALDLVRERQLQNILSLQNLKTACRNYFWQHADTLSPNLNRLTPELREELAADAGLRVQR